MGSGFSLVRITNYLYKTRMHSSRMRTGRSLTVCRSLVPGGGVVLSPRGVYLVLGGVLSLGGCQTWGVSDLGGCLPQTCPPCEQKDRQV